MCNVCISKKTYSHHEILTEFKIDDKMLPPNFCAWEFVPRQPAGPAPKADNLRNFDHIPAKNEQKEPPQVPDRSTLPEFAGMAAAEIEEKANQLTRDGIEGSIHHENERYAEQQGWKRPERRVNAPEDRAGFERIPVVK